MDTNVRNSGCSPARPPDQAQLEAMLGEMRPSPGGRFYRRMARAPWADRSADRLPMSRRPVPRSTVALALAAALLAVTLVAATPQGRALAQSVLRFFTRLQGDTQEIASEGAPARLPFQDVCGSVLFPRCSVAQVREMVGFPVLELGRAPQDMSFVGASGGPERVFLLYRGIRGSVLLAESPVESDDAADWEVGAGASVESVIIRGVAGEYVQGAWGGVGEVEDASVAWDEWPAAQTLRWEENAIRYTISFRASKSGNGPVFGRDDLVGFAVGLTSETVASLPASAPSSSIEEVAAQAGFGVTQPAWLPAGYTFDHATYSTEHRAACLYYHYLDLEGWPLLTIAETDAGGLPALADLQTVALFNGQPVQVAVDQQTVAVGGAAGGQGLLAITGVDTSTLCGGEAQHANMSLFWEAGGRGFVLFASIDQYDGRGFLTPLEMQRVAESLTGVSTIPAGTVDPGRLPSLEAAETLAGFDLRSPSRVPDGFAFAYAAYRVDDAPEVVLLYLAPTRDSIGRSHGYVLSQTTGSPNTLEEVALGGGYEWISVHGEPAVYRQMCWDETAEGLDANCYLELSWFEAGIRFDVFANLPGAEVSREALLDMAESMQ